MLSVTMLNRLKSENELLCGCAIVVPKYLLIEITKQMEWFNTNVGSLESTLYQTPEVLQPISVYLPVHITLCMIDNLMDVFFVQSQIGVAIIGIEVRTIFDVIFYQSMQSVTLSVLKNLSSYFAAAFQNSAVDCQLSIYSLCARRSARSAGERQNIGFVSQAYGVFTFNSAFASSKRRAIFSPLHCCSSSVSASHSLRGTPKKSPP